MRIVRFHKTGGPEVLQLDEVPVPEPTGNEVVFRVEAFALNQADILFINGMHYTQPIFPSRIGSEAVGIVTAIGEDVKKYNIGDRVTSIPFYTQQYGVQGEFAVVPETYLSEVPSNYSIEEATSFWMQYLTAYYAFMKLGEIKKDDWVFIPATSGTAGQGALKFAKSIGAKVIGSTRSLDKKEFLFELGADQVVVTDTEHVSERLQAITNGNGVQFVFDPIGGTNFNGSYMSQLSFGGTAVLYGLLSGEETLFPILDLVRNNTKIHAYSMFNYVMDHDLLEEGKSDVMNKIMNDDLRPLVDKVFPFEDTVEAYKYMLSGKQRGKIVVKV